MNDSDTPRRLPVVDALLTVFPFAFIAGILVAWSAAPQFYLRYILREESREAQLVETMTVSAALAAACILLWQGVKLLRAQRGNLIGGRGGGAIVTIIGAAAFFFAGEEVSWGQTWFGWKTPDSIREHTIETNLHNVNLWGFLEVQTLGSVFLVVMFFGLPLAWALRDRGRRRLPESWRPAVAEIPAIVTMAVAFAWKEVKSIYRLFNPGADPDDSGVYGEFIDQFNEIKECLVAAALLIYAMYRIRAVRAWVDGNGQSQPKV